VETTLNAEGTNIEPVDLRLSFANVSRRPIKVETWALHFRHLTFEVTGPDARSVRRRRLAGGAGGVTRPTDWPTLAPGETWDKGGNFLFPNPLGGQVTFALLEPGEYCIKITYAHTPEAPLEDAAGSWTGALTSNEIRLKVLPAPGGPPPPGPVLEIRKLLGDVHTDVRDPARPVMLVSLRGTDVRDSDLRHLKSFTRLKFLDLGWTDITDAGLVHLKGLGNLERLSLDKTRVTDKGLARLGGLPRLEHLNLASTDVTDAGLAQLRKLAGLQSLDLSFTRATAAGVRELQKALPGASIRYFPRSTPPGVGR
jgi:hypothetical protein